MYKKTITYEDYDGNKRTEDFYFSLTTAELTKMQMSVDGGYAAMIDNMVKAQDMRSLINAIEDVVIKSYGIKSDDGRRFIKNPTITEEFMQTPAYSSLYMELITDENAAADFINKIIPSDLAAKVEKYNKEKPTVTNLPSNT
jgi:hypothetical protein